MGRWGVGENFYSLLTNKKKSATMDTVSKTNAARGCSSVVERNLAKVDVARSNRVTRLNFNRIPK